MSLGITWNTVEEAAAKYCLATPLILKWVEAGLIRTEQTGIRQLRVNMDDIELMVHEVAGI